MFLNSLNNVNEFTKVRQDLLHFDSIMNLIYYELTSVTCANDFSKHQLDFLFLVVSEAAIVSKYLNLHRR